MHMPAGTMPFRDSIQSCAAPAHIHRRRGDGLDLVEVKSSSVSELHLTVTPMKGESINVMTKRIP
jgi:hypothetical protein